MTTIKNFFALLLLVALATFSNTNAVMAQAGGANPKTELLNNANQVEDMVMLLLPAVQRVREAAARTSLEKILKETQTIAQKVQRAGAGMTEAQFAQFTREFEANDNAYDTWAKRHKSVQDCITDCKNNSNSSYWRRICIQNCISSWITLQVNNGGN